jgi:1-acyl-sn-glycerol-3-phosphate acyltransferase
MSSLKSINIPLIFYETMVWLLHCICLFFFRIEIQGREKVIEWKKKNKIAFVAIARHRSLWDAGLMPVAFGGSRYTIMNYVTKVELSRFFRLIPFSGTYLTFINREKVGKSIIKKSIGLLVKGINVAIFPEGTTIPDYKETKRGVIVIIKKAEQKLRRQIPIFPLNIKIIKGFYGKPKGRWQDYLLRKVKIELKIGEPIFLKELEKLVGQDFLRKDKEEEMVKLLLEQADQI